MRRIRPISAILIAIALYHPWCALAQSSQYTGPGQLAEAPEDRQELLEEDMEQARWQLGPVRLQPFLGIRDMGFEDATAATGASGDGDFTATAAAGLTAYLPTGPKVTWEAHAVPEYVYWAKESDRSRINGRYGASVYGFFNRLTLETRAGRQDQQGIATPEYERRATTRRDELEVLGEVRFGRLVLFAEGREEELRYLVDDLDDPLGQRLDALDRDESAGRTGVRYRPRDSIAVGAGVEVTDTTFQGQGAADRSSSGTSPFVELELSGNRIYSLLELTFESLDPDDDSVFVPYEEETGRVLVSLFPERRLVPQLYTGRALSYSVEPDYAYFTDERWGTGVAYTPRPRISITGFVESGTLDYQVIGPGVPPRQDDLLAFGVEAQWEVGRLVVELGFSSTDYDSTLPGFDRKVTAFETGIRLGGDLIWE